jgi:hypothetical protein
MASLLAVDLGLRTGLALYGGEGRLVWYRSRHFGSPGQLRRRARALLDEAPDLDYLILEGGGPIAQIWEREGLRHGAQVRQISAEQWRSDLLYPRQHRNGDQAKQSADDLARRVIEWSGARRPTSLRHDAAEAILVGLWGVLDVGWLEALPAEVGR